MSPEALELRWQASQVAGLVQGNTVRKLLPDARRAELLSRGGQVEDALALATQVREQGSASRHAAVAAQAESSLRAVCSAHGRLEDAALHGTRAVALWREWGEAAACARALFTLGGDEMYLAHPEAAWQHLQEALSIFEALGDRLGAADTLGSLAVTEDSRNRRAGSRAYQLRALEPHRAIGSLIGTG